MQKTNPVKELLEKGVSEGIFPGAVLIAAHGGEVILFEEAGYSSLKPHKNMMSRDTIFDLASLTKPLATTLGVMKLVDNGDILPDQRIWSILKESIPEDKRNITPRLLLCHCSGLPHWIPLYSRVIQYPPAIRKKMARRVIMESSLVAMPGEKVIYSDPGFIILEWIIEKITGMTMHSFVDHHFYGPLSLGNTFFCNIENSCPFEEDRFAATEYCEWRGRIMRGVVHDENAYALGGYSGHAGLFGTAEDVYLIVEMLRNHFYRKSSNFFRPETVAAFFERQEIAEGSTWALGWDTPSAENSSSGKYFSRSSLGHLGFTGTSIWIDLEKDVIIIFLTNRVHPTRTNEKIKLFRPVIHDRIMEYMGAA
ncbi:MAG: serine hydrolase [Deltaproteobacteria bacterium]|nr:serine hydrolase [Deltaproteobacteria bacterium]